MARILYAVHGSLHGHAMRALTIARHYREHEFLFLSQADGIGALRKEFPTIAFPTLGTEYANHRVAAWPTILSNLKAWASYESSMEKLCRIIDSFQPQAAITDYEFFLPIACHKLGVPCLSIDHQHIITLCRHHFPLSQTPGYLFTSLLVRTLFSKASHYMVVSFFKAPPNSSNFVLVPPLLRDTVTRNSPTPGDHVLGYVGKYPSEEFLRFLEMSGRPVMVYGMDCHRDERNLHFRRHSETGLLNDLASCCFVICGGGHTLISEALYYGKPILSYPMNNAFEQYMNAFYLEKLGYGRRIRSLDPGSGVIESFESHIDDYREKIAGEDFHGNGRIFSLLDGFISTGTLEVASPWKQNAPMAHGPGLR